MRTAAENAIRLDPLLAEAHDALGMVYMRDGKWAQSESSFRRAIELDRSDSGAYNDFSTWLLLPLGRIDEAVGQLRLAAKADPLSPFIQQRLAAMLMIAGRYDEAAAHCGSDAECLGRARLGQGRIDEAIQILSTFNKTAARETPGIHRWQDGSGSSSLSRLRVWAGRPARGRRKTCNRCCAKCVLTGADLCRLGRQRSHFASPGSRGWTRCCTDRPGPQLSGVRSPSR